SNPRDKASAAARTFPTSSICAAGQRWRGKASAGSVTMKSPRAPPLRTRILCIRLRGGFGRERRRALVRLERRGAGADLEFHLELHRQPMLVLRDPHAHRAAALEHALRRGLVHARLE